MEKGEVSEVAVNEVTLLTASGKAAGKKQIPDRFFADRVAVHLLHQYTRWQRNKKRAGTHSVLTRAEVRGGGAKPWKQKGTGRARAGSNTSPLWVGGGVAHGPKQRSYEFSLNKKERKQALSMALRVRFDEARFLVVDDFGLGQIKTKDAATVLQSLGIGKGDLSLVVIPEKDEILLKSLRNMAHVTVLSASGLNVYDIMNNTFVVIVGPAFDELQGRMARVSA